MSTDIAHSRMDNAEMWIRVHVVDRMGHDERRRDPLLPHSSPYHCSQRYLQIPLELLLGNDSADRMGQKRIALDMNINMHTRHSTIQLQMKLMDL